MEPNFQMKISLWILQLETSQVAENTSRVQIYMLGFAARSPRARPKVTAPAKRGSPTAPPALALPLTWTWSFGFLNYFSRQFGGYLMLF